MYYRIFSCDTFPWQLCIAWTNWTVCYVKRTSCKFYHLPTNISKNQSGARLAWTGHKNTLNMTAYVILTLFLKNYIVRTVNVTTSLTYKLVSDSNSVLEILRGHEDTVDEGDQCCLVRHDLRRPQLVHDYAELVPVLLGNLATSNLYS